MASLIPRHSKKVKEEHLVAIVCACVAPQAFLGNLETIVILVCVAWPYVTESWITGVVTSIGHVLYTFSKVGKPRMLSEGRTTDGKIIRTCLYGNWIWQVAIRSYRLYLCLASTLKGSSSILPSQPWLNFTVLLSASSAYVPRWREYKERGRGNNLVLNHSQLNVFT